MTANDAEKIRRNMDSILAIDDAIGGYTTKADCRQTGCSIHFKFDNKVDVNTTMRFFTLIEQCPGMLVNAMRLLLGDRKSVV